MNYRMAISIIILFAGCMAPVHIAGKLQGKKEQLPRNPWCKKAWIGRGVREH